jgi:alanine racemase
MLSNMNKGTGCNILQPKPGGAGNKIEINMVVKSFNQIEISKSALRHNYTLLKKFARAKTRLLAMVKADAYGHGMFESAQVFQRAGCRDFGVAEVDEGVQLRESGIKGNIFVFLGFAVEDASLFFTHELIPIIYDIESARILSSEAVTQNKEITVHVKVDCGMTRLGIMPDEFEEFVAVLQTLPGIKYGGLASHYPRADEPDSVHTSEQFLRFECLGVSDSKVPDLVAHTANSGGILYFPDSSCSMVRAGISLYGYYPDGARGIKRAIGEKLQPAMSFKTSVLQVKSVPTGTGVSYGHTYVTNKKTTIAVLPVGYEDGLSRSLSNKGEVLLHGKRAAIIGRICMNLCMIDVTEIQGVQKGDEVVLLGTQQDETINGDAIAQLMDSISYEVLCLFGNNNQRRYVK